jgi:hypothetical protein
MYEQLMELPVEKRADSDREKKFNRMLVKNVARIEELNLNQKQFDSRLFNLENEQNPGDPDDNNLDY